MKLNHLTAPARNRAVLALITSFAIGALASVSPAIGDAPGQTFEPPLRDLWQRGSERFNRQWLIAGPVPSQAANALDTRSLQPNAGQPLSAELASVRWSAHGAWTDVTDLNTLAPVDISNADGLDQTIFVAAKFKRLANSEEDLLLSSERPFATWVNGRELQSHTTREGFLPDRHRVPVNFRQGDNLVVMRIHVTSVGPSQISVRAVPRGTIPEKQLALAPIILPSGSNELAIQTHFAKDDGAPVDVIVQAAGGRQVAKRRAARGDVARFDTKAWRAGAYEVRIVTNDAWGQTKSTFLPWYHGDAREGIRALMNEAENAQAGVLGDTLRMLTAMTKDRVGGSVDSASPSIWRLVHSPLMEFEELMLGRSDRAHGFARLAYTDEVDGSTQFCRAYLPAQYNAKKAWPLITVLHGFNPANPEYIDWWSVDERHNLVASQRPVIVVEPHGRGNAQYIGIGERDVLRCIEEATRRFSIDNERVYLTGESMGGHGTWYVASRHPDLFAAAAPVYGGWDFRVTSIAGPPTERPPRSALDAYRQERASSFSNAENLLHVPLLVLHGDADSAVSVENSRHAVKMMQRWGYNIRYHEMPEWAHEDLGQRLAVADWLLAHQRVGEPRTVRLRSTDLAGASAYWFSVSAFERSSEVIRVKAEFLQPGVLRVDSTNVAAFALDVPASLRGSSKQLRLIWNGHTREVATEHGRVAISSGDKNTAPLKRASLEGPLPAVLATPFTIIVGTTSTDARMRQFIQARADALAHQWRGWQKQPLSVVRDIELSEQEARTRSLILLGDAQANAITRRLADRLPFNVSATHITVGERRWQVADAVLQVIYPSPLADDRYVYVIAPTSADGMYLVKPQLVHFQMGNPVTTFDWIIQDGRRAPPGTTNPADAFLAAGVFDAKWGYQEETTLYRDELTTAKWTLRRAPPTDFKVSRATLESVSGQYELFPGFVLSISPTDDGLRVDVPGNPALMLTAESESIFVDPVTGDAFEVMRNEQGEITGAAADTINGVLFVKRLEAQN